jgi:hypothetical protein
VTDRCCEKPGCSLPCTICPACEQCFCWQHLRSSSCEACQRLVAQRSFKHRLGRLVSIGLSVLLCGLLFLLLPRDEDGIIIQLVILLLVCGALLIWLGLLAHTRRSKDGLSPMCR